MLAQEQEEEEKEQEQRNTRSTPEAQVVRTTHLCCMPNRPRVCETGKLRQSIPLSQETSKYLLRRYSDGFWLHIARKLAVEVLDHSLILFKPSYLFGPGS